MGSYPGWAQAVLKSLGAPASANNLRLLNAWQRAEGGGARFNPLNTTQPAPGASNFNSIGVKNYLSANQGTSATSRTLLNGRYDAVVAGLRQNAAPAQIARAVGDSPWGTSGSLILDVLGSPGGGGGSPVAPPAVSTGPPSTPSFAAPSAPKPASLKLPSLDLMPLAANDAFSKIAQGWQPTQTLGFLSDEYTKQMLQTPRLAPGIPAPPQQSFDPRGHETTRAGNAPDPGGGWMGTYGPATSIAHLAERYGLQPTSQKRDTKLTSSGNPSDHWVGSKNAYAYDLGGTVAEMDKAARAITQRLGIPYSGGELVASVVRHGLRYQVLYRTNVGGNHFTHVHVGVKRVG